MEGVLAAEALGGKIGPVTRGALYFLVVSADISLPGYCTSFCASHAALAWQASGARYVGSAGTSTSFFTPYAVVGSGCAACAWQGFASSSVLLESASLIVHELVEAITDPLGTAWLNLQHDNENEDLCNWKLAPFYGAPQGYVVSPGPKGVYWNLNVSGNLYLVQSNWDLVNARCSMDGLPYSPPNPPLPPSPTPLLCGANSVEGLGNAPRHSKLRRALLLSPACTCINGFMGADCTITPSPPPSPPVATWDKADNYETIALDIPLNIYAGNQSFYQEAFVKGVSNALGVDTDTVSVSMFQGTAGGAATVVAFNIVLYGSSSSSSAVVTAEAANVQNLFCDSSNITQPGSPACPSLLSALQAEGLPLAGAFYNDMLTPSQWTAAYLLQPNASLVGTWNRVDNDEVIAVDIPFVQWARNEEAYKAAFVSALAGALGVDVATVWVSGFQQSSTGGTLLAANILLFGTSSSSSAVVTQNVARVGALFASSETGAPALPTCAVCPSTPTSLPPACLCPGFLQRLQTFGLPATGAYLYDQLY